MVTTLQIISSNNCSICLNNIYFLRWKCIQCHNSFHRKCIHTWKYYHPDYPFSFTCPICKKKYKNYENIFMKFKYYFIIFYCVYFFITLFIVLASTVSFLTLLPFNIHLMK